MALVVKDRVQETTTTTGTGTITLAGAVSGFQSFSVIGNANTTYYAIVGQSTSEWEVGIGTYTSSGTTLSRDTILASSNSGSAVNLSAGTKNVFVTYPADKSVYEDASNNVTLPADLSVNGNTTLGDASGDSVTFNAATVSTPNGLNFDSNTFVIDATNNRVGVGTATPFTLMQVYSSTDAAVISLDGEGQNSNLRVTRYSNDTTAPLNSLRKSRGTLLSPTAVASGDVMGSYNFNAYGGSNFRILSQINGTVDTYVSDTNISSFLTFTTTPAGSVTPQERVRITSAGNVGIGISSPGVALDVLGTIEAQVALTNDTIAIAGRAGGTGSFVATITPTTLSASRTVTLPDANITVAGLGVAQTWTAAQTFRAASAIRSEAASTQDAMVLAGRGGGTGSFAVTLTPTTLSANRTATFPNADTTIPVATQVLTFSGPTAARTYTLPDAATTLVGLTDTQTLTNKRVTPRVSTTTSSATPTINTDTTDIFGLTAQTVDVTSFSTNLSGTPTNGQKLWIYIVGTASRAITWGASFEASTVALPTTTVTTSRLDVGFVWNAVSAKWRCVAVA